MKIAWYVVVLSVMWHAQPVFAQAPAVSEEKPPLILLQALNCLDSDQGWMRSYLRKHKDAWVSFSVDTGNPPEVVDWTIVVRESESRGHFFEVTRENDHGTMVFRLLDNDSFTIKPGKLEFDRLFPLSWKYFERRVKDALQNRRFIISASEIQNQRGSYTCDYTRH